MKKAQLDGLTPQLGKDSSMEYVFHGSLLRLEHFLTRKNLHSDLSFRSPSKKMQEVSCFGENGKGNINDDWKCVIVDQANDGPLEIGQAFRLRHMKTKKLLVCGSDDFAVKFTAGIFPNYQKEIGCLELNECQNDSDLWFIDKIIKKELISDDFMVMDK